MFQWSMQANKKYIYDSEKAPIYVLSHSKIQKAVNYLHGTAQTST